MVGQGKRLGIWKDFEAAEESQHSAENFTGKVVEVNSGDCITVEKDSDFSVIRLYLASVKAPKITYDSAESYGWESKEALRKTAIGKKVKVETEYSREVVLKSGQTMHMTFASLFLAKNDKNLGVVQLEKGLAFTNL
jgi:endonuclease YncB( thermonuclease family)